MNMNDSKYTANIGVVIVTFNRLEKLIKTLKAYADQTLVPAYIVVVNNASSDGTAAYLEKWASQKEPFKKYILNYSPIILFNSFNILFYTFFLYYLSNFILFSIFFLYLFFT